MVEEDVHTQVQPVLIGLLLNNLCRFYRGRTLPFGSILVGPD